MMNKKGQVCAYGILTEAWAVGGANDGDKMQAVLCVYPGAQPERFEGVPVWIEKAVAGGRLVNEHDCQLCPAFKFKGQWPS